MQSILLYCVFVPSKLFHVLFTITIIIIQCLIRFYITFFRIEQQRKSVRLALERRSIHRTVTIATAADGQQLKTRYFSRTGHRRSARVQKMINSSDLEILCLYNTHIIIIYTV